MLANHSSALILTVFIV